jgi:hypothetical protein
VYGKKCAAFQHGWCSSRWTARSHEENWRIPQYVLINWAASAMLRRVCTTGEANIGTVRIWCPA